MEIALNEGNKEVLAVFKGVAKSEGIFELAETKDKSV